MEEGWNRIAHEALLSHTPVIGSNSGGMKELLEKAGQVVVNDKTEIYSAVEKVLSQREIFAEKGYEFVKQFDMKYFSNAWIVLVKEVTKN